MWQQSRPEWQDGRYNINHQTFFPRYRCCRSRYVLLSVVGVVVVVVGGTWVMVNVASQFSGGSATPSGSVTLMEHWLEGASPCTVMLRSAVTSVAPMFMVLELMVIYCAQVASTSITSLSRSVGVSSMTSVLMKVTITSRVSSCTPIHCNGIRLDGYAISRYGRGSCWFYCCSRL